ncbi:hypothetical protein P879_05842 [Paragonimus westermani]|uniref:LTD domain-containing protein n=1 Tax=Paragonimus westermani TaxID=34504 RepID=A0A8T0DSH8_9TREM|nr:hypothetical protein P879_05842 [Paragonimus westermani]
MQKTKNELEEINNRLAAYVHRVRQLKNEDDLKTLTSAIAILEQDLRSLKASYECQLNHLTCSMRIISEEKCELEKELIARKQNDAHFLDRLITADDINANLSNELSNTTAKLTANEKLSNERILRLKSQLDWYIAQFASLDAKIQDVNKKEAAIPEILAKLKKSTRNELRQHQQQITSFFRKSLLTLQSQLSEERKETRSLKSAKNSCDQTILSLQKQNAELKAKLQNMQHQNGLLESAFKSAQKEIVQSRHCYEEKVRELESTIAAQTSESLLAQNDASIVSKELARLKAVLENEERRLNLSHSNTNTQIGRNTFSGESSENVTRLFKDEDSECKNVSPNCFPYDSLSFSGFADTKPLSDKNSNHSHKEYTKNEELDEKYKVISRKTSPVSAKDCQTMLVDRHSCERYSDDNCDRESRLSVEKNKSSKDVSHWGENGKNRSNAIGQLHICEVDPDGRFIRIWNASDRNEADLSSYELIQNSDGQCANVYSFGCDIRLGPRSLITLWARCATDSALNHHPPKSVRCEGVDAWGYGPSFTTMLCDPTGQAVAWLNPPYRCKTSHAHHISLSSRSSKEDFEMNERSPTLVKKGLTSGTQIKRPLNCDAVNMPQNQETGASGCLPVTPDLVRSDRSQLLSFRHSNSAQNCVCDLTDSSQFQKTKRPNAKQLLIQLEFPTTFGFHKNGKDKVSHLQSNPTINLI